MPTCPPPDEIKREDGGGVYLTHSQLFLQQEFIIVYIFELADLATSALLMQSFCFVLFF